MKRNYFSKYIFVIFTLVSLIFVSCSNIFDESETDSKSTLYIRLSDKAGRTILPDTSIDDFTDFILIGTKGESTEAQNLGTWSTAEALDDASVEIDSGEWSLTLSAKKEGVAFSGTTTVNVKSGEVNTASFTLMPGKNIQNAKIDITLHFPETSGVYSVEWNFSSDKKLHSFCYVNQSGIEDRYSSKISYALTNNSFTLKGDIINGKHETFTCNFYGLNGHLIGSYIDDIYLGPGLTSKLDYTIEYFREIGFTRLESTDNGIEFTIKVPKRVKNVDIYRKESDGNTNDSFTRVMSKYYADGANDNITISDVDYYDYSAGKSYEYYVNYDWSFQSPHMTVTATKDGWQSPVFTTYPQYAVESDSTTGISTKLKITNDPVVDYKGHGDGCSYYINLNYEDHFYPELSASEKEIDIAEENLVPGPNRAISYTYSVKKEGGVMSHNFEKYIYGNLQPPALQGGAAAIATEDGIRIKVHTSKWASDVELQRATSANGPYTVIAATAQDYTNSTEWFEYLDKYNQTAGTTYYYKVTRKFISNQTFGGDYFSATALVNKDSPVSVTQMPTLSMIGATIKFNTEGNVTISDESLQNVRKVWEYEYSCSDDAGTYKIFVHREKNDIDVCYSVGSTTENYIHYDLKASGVERNLFKSENPFTGKTYNLTKASLHLGGSDEWYNEYSYAIDLPLTNLPDSVTLSPVAACPDGIQLNLYIGEDLPTLTVMRSEGDSNNWKEIGMYYSSFIDRYDLKEGVTYHYKLVDSDGKTYGDTIYDVVSQVTKAAPVEITTAPSFSLGENSTIGTYTPGVYKINDESLSTLKAYTYFTYATSDSKRKLEINYSPTSEYIYVTAYNNDSNGEDENASEMDSYSDTYYPDSVDVYNELLDGETISLVSAVVKFGVNEYQIVYTKELVSSCCPQNIILPKRAVTLKTEATTEGIKLIVSNIPAKTESLTIYSGELGENSYNGIYNLMNDNNDSAFVPTSLELLDNYVDAGTSYIYYVYLNYLDDDNSSQTYQSRVRKVSKAIGGDGELSITATSDSNTNGIILTCPVGLNSINRHKTDIEDRNAYYQNICCMDGFVKTVPFTDCFVNAGNEYKYVFSFSESKETKEGFKYSYNPHTKETTITATSGLGEVIINNSPVIYCDNSTKKLSFSTEPVIAGIKEMDGTQLSTSFSYYNSDYDYKAVPWPLDNTAADVSNLQTGTYTRSSNIYEISFWGSYNDKPVSYSVNSEKSFPGLQSFTIE